MKKTSAAVCLAGLLLAALCACSSASITGIEVTAPAVLERGESAALTVEYQYDREAPDEAQAAELAAALGLGWSSSDESVVTVDAGGTLTAVGRGEADITAASADGTITNSAHVAVRITPQSIALPEALTFSMTAPEYDLVPVIEPADADALPVTWRSSDESVATVDAAGHVTGLAEGTATITAGVEGTDLTASCEMTFAPKITSFTVSQASFNMKVGDVVPVGAITEPVAVSQEAVQWETTDPDVVTVDEKGTMTAVDEGYSLLLARIKGVQVFAFVIVDNTGERFETTTYVDTNSSGTHVYEQPQGAQYVFTDAEYGLCPYRDFDMVLDVADLPPEGAATVWKNHLKCAFATSYGVQGNQTISVAVAEGVNAIRAQYGLAPLVLDESLSEIAYDRANYCAQNGLDGHRGSQTNGEILGVDSSLCANAALNGWYRSPGHRNVILQPQWTRMGTAVSYYRAGDAGTISTTSVVVFM